MRRKGWRPTIWRRCSPEHVRTGKVLSVNDAPFPLDRVFTRSFALLCKAPIPIVAIALLFNSIPQLLWDLAEMRLTAGLPDGDGRLIGIDFMTMAVALTEQALVQAGVTMVAMDVEDRGALSFRRYAARITWLALPLFALTLINFVVTGIGVLLLLIPGMIIMTMWSVSGAVLAVERVGITAALHESGRLTKGARWPIFGLISLLIVVTLAVTTVVGFAGQAAGIEIGILDSERRDWPAYVVWILVGSTVMTAIWCSVIASLYIELRAWQNGPSDNQLAEVFA